MKNVICIIIVLIGTFHVSFAQSSKKVFTAESVVWFGLDFSKVKLLDGAGINYPEEVKTRFAPAWNRLFLEERDKYNLQDAYSAERVKYDIEAVKEVNKTIVEEEIVTLDSYEIEKGTIDEMVKLYTSKHTSGIGLVYIVESLSKIDEAAAVHVTFFDIESRNILFQKKLLGTPRGFGLRNYWAGAYYDVIKQCRKNWKKWSKGK